MSRIRIHALSHRSLTAVLVLVALVATAMATGLTPARAANVLPITQTVSGSLVVGQDVTFHVSLTNGSTTTILEGIDDNVPSGVTFISVKSTGTVCGGTHGNALIICSPVNLAPGASIGYALTVRPLAAGPLTNTALGDPDFLDSSQVTVQVAPAPTDVQVTGSASTGSPARGATFTYTFQVKDNGPWSAGDVAFADPLPSQVTFVGVTTNSGSPCSFASGTVSCDLGGLNVGQQVNVVVTVIAPSAPATFTNTANVTPSVTDTQPANNSVAVTVQVK